MRLTDLDENMQYCPDDWWRCDRDRRDMVDLIGSIMCGQAFDLGAMSVSFGYSLALRTLINGVGL